MKSVNSFYGHTYYYKEGILVASPTNSDGTYDLDCDIPVDEFAEPLTEKELKEVKALLK